MPVQLQRAMAAEAEASREARAKVIAAEGEQKASRALREASEVIGDSPAALQLRYLQVIFDLLIERSKWMICQRHIHSINDSHEMFSIDSLDFEYDIG